MKRALFCAVLANAAAAQTPIDFSYAGFGGGGIAPPVVNTVITLRASGGDDTAAIQAAIDRAGASAPGAVQLEAGLYRVGGHLVMPASGVVLRGSGDVTLEATGKSRRTLIEIGGSSEPRTAQPIAVTEDAPAGARSLAVGDASAFHRGDRIVITRPSTAEWITALHMRGLPGTYANQRLDWAPGSRNLVWDRIVERVEGSKITVDAPITTALEKRYGGGTIALVTAIEPVSYVGIDNLTIVSDSATRPSERRRPLVDRHRSRSRRRCVGSRGDDARLRRFGGTHRSAGAPDYYRAMPRGEACLRASRIPAAELPCRRPAGVGE